MSFERESSETQPRAAGTLRYVVLSNTRSALPASHEKQLWMAFGDTCRPRPVQLREATCPSSGSNTSITVEYLKGGVKRDLDQRSKGEVSADEAEVPPVTFLLS